MLKYPSSPKMMSMTTKIETINFALTLRPIRWNQRGWDTRASSNGPEEPLDLSVSSICGHREFFESRFAECRDMRLLLGEDGQVSCHRAKNGKPERNEHRGDRHFRPLGGIAGAGRAFDSGDGDVQTIGYKTEQRQHRCQIQSLRALANLRHQQHAERYQDREEDFQQEEPLRVARYEHQPKDAAMIQVLELQDAVECQHHHQHASQVLQDGQFQFTAEVLRTH